MNNNTGMSRKCDVPFFICVQSEWEGDGALHGNMNKPTMRMRSQNVTYH